MKINFRQLPIKKCLVIIIFLALIAYVAWDLSVKVANYYFKKGFTQGYARATSLVVSQAENDNCVPFKVVFGEKEVSLINVSCLKMSEHQQEMRENNGE